MYFNKNKQKYQFHNQYNSLQKNKNFKFDKSIDSKKDLW